MNNTSTNLKQPESKATPNQADTPVNLGRGQNTPIKSGRGARVNSKKRLTEKVSENTPVMVEINRFFRRRPTTLWAVGDARKLEDINPAQEDIELLAEWFKADLTGYDGHNGKPFIPRQRTQLSTLLNHWDDELDKARANLPLLQGTTAGKPPRPPGTGWFWNGVDWVK